MKTAIINPDGIEQLFNRCASGEFMSFSEFDKAIIEYDKEYEEMLCEVSKVYCELTNNKLSKPNYMAAVILDEVRLQQDKDIEDAVNISKQEFKDLIDETKMKKPKDESGTEKVFREIYNLALTELRGKIEKKK